MWKLYKYEYIEGPWFVYQLKGETAVRWCQPDGLIVDVKSGKIVIVEIKLKHTSDSWHQLRKLYLPIVRQTFGDKFQYGLSTFVKWFDVSISYPERIALGKHPKRAGLENIQVTIWKP